MAVIKEWLAFRKSRKPVVLLDRTAMVQRFYTKRALLYHLIWVKLLGWERALEKFFRKLDCVRPGLKILDAGCGTGAATQALYKIADRPPRPYVYGFIELLTFHAFDLTPAMLKSFKKWAAMSNATRDFDVISWRRANVLNLDDLPPDWSEYDLIIASGMLEHLSEDNMITALSNLKRLLKNDGVLLAFVTTTSFFTRCFGRHIRHRWQTNFYSDDQLRRIFFDAGFNNTKPTKVRGAWGLMMAIEARG